MATPVSTVTVFSAQRDEGDVKLPVFASEIVLGAKAFGPEDLDATYCLYTWNQARYVEEAVRSALTQQGCRLEIIISDDASTDGSWERILSTVEGYSGPHRVRVRRNPKNLGIDHFSSLLCMAGCDIVVHAHGDDVATPNRVEAMLRAFAQSGASVVSSNAILIDAQGHSKRRLVRDARDRSFTTDDLIETVWNGQMTGALLAIRREVYDRFPWLDSRLLARGHDHVVPWRGTLLNGFYWIGEPLLHHRKHAEQWRNRFYDESTPETKRETGLAQALSVGRVRRRDINHLLVEADDGSRRRLIAIREALDARMASLYDDWLDLREDLIRHGMRAAWESDATKRPRKRGLAAIGGRLMRKFRKR